MINDFYIKKFRYKPKIAVAGLNPHCESVDIFDEDKKIIRPAIKYLSKLKYKIAGPFASDTIFLKKNRNNYLLLVA